ncbi:MAG TPA: hypothetical protein VGP73_26095 [Thermoanaerobaculia bacterium]
MKKVVLFALLAVVAAASAQAQYLPPAPSTYFYCTYTNTQLHEVNGADGGFSRFDISAVRPDYYQGTETFLATYGVDQRKVTFAKPVNFYNIYGELVRTQWEFTINPYGPQCKNTVVRNGGYSISFQNCTDGSSRVCSAY